MARQTLTAVVEAVNERGVRVNGQWHNFSSYAQNGAIDRTVQAGDTAELELTNTGWIRKLTVKARAATQPNPQEAPQAPNAMGARALDAAQYARLRAVELASAAALHYSDSVEGYLENLSALANWIARYVEEGDPLA
jgi:hypothetical protein